jgi:putative transposase
MTEVIRNMKCSICVENKMVRKTLLEYARCVTSTYNVGAKAIEERDAIREAEEKPFFEEWKLANPVEAAEYDQEFAAATANHELTKDCKRKGLPLPDKIDFPKRPDFMKWCLDKWIVDNPVEGAAYKAQDAAYRDYKKQVEHCKKYNLPEPPKVEKPFCPKIRLTNMVSLPEMREEFRKVRDSTDALAADGKGRIPVTRLWVNTNEVVLKELDVAKKEVIKRRVNNERATFPRVKPDYAVSPLTFYPSQKNIWWIERVEHYDKKNNESYIHHFLYLDSRRKDKDGKKIMLKMRFFPNREYRVEDIRQIKIGKEIGERRWWLILSLKISASNEPLPDMKIGVDANAGENNHVVVADENRELYRISMPALMGKLDDEIQELKRKKALLLKSNGNDHKSREARKIRKRIRRLYARIKNIRNNTLHHISKKIVHTGNVVVMEDLDLRKMTKSAKGTKKNPGKDVQKKTDMNRKMLGVSHGRLREMVKYKSHGLEHSKFILVNPAYTSLRCAECHVIGIRHVEAGRPFECVNPACLSYGIKVDGDANAARNIVGIAINGKGNEVRKPIEKTSSSQIMIEAKAKKKADRAKSQVAVANIVDKGEILENFETDVVPAEYNASLADAL